MSRIAQNILILLLILFAVSGAEAQNLNRVELKDGTVIEGEVKQWILDSILVLHVGYTDIIIQHHRIAKVSSISSQERTIKPRQSYTMVAPRRQRPPKARYSSHKLKDSGFYLSPSISAHFFGVGYDAVAGYRWNRFLGVGVYGGGVLYGTQSLATHPVGLDFRGHFHDSAQSQFYYLRGGYGFARQSFNNEFTEGGVHAEGGFGFAYQQSEYSAFYFSMGISRQGAVREYERVLWWTNGTEQIREEMRLHRLIFRIGWMF